MEQVPLFLLLFYALYEGLLHAFEADHVLAVTTIVSQREEVRPALKDGIFWGLGHTSTIFLIGLVMMLLKVHIPEGSFSVFEAIVGLMLVTVASYRLYLFLRHEEVCIHRHGHQHRGTNEKPHLHVHGKGLHRASYGIGLVHGLAGSGALVVLVMTQIETLMGSFLYLILFGIGSIAGMTVVAGVFSLPFSGRLLHSKRLRVGLVLVSSALCFGYGCYVAYSNLFA
ncbi:MAG: hypothetical protein LBB27_03675 [Tannerellaceae bacterium]|jgi:hypothetical protein|nr:hypothetical protein [Tannerellaceae bacterium]